MSGKIIYFPVHERAKTMNSKSQLHVSQASAYQTPPGPQRRYKQQARDRYTLVYYALIAMPLLAALPLVINYYLKLKH